MRARGSTVRRRASCPFRRVALTTITTGSERGQRAWPRGDGRSVAGPEEAGVVADIVAAEVALASDHADVEVMVCADPDHRVAEGEAAELSTDRPGELVALVEA